MTNQKGNVVVLVILVIGAILSLSTAIFVFVKTREIPAAQETNTMPTVTPFAFVPAGGTQNTQAPVATSSAVVTIQKENELSSAIKNSLQSRVINPFLEYYKDQNGADFVKSLTISVNTQKSATEFPYKADYVFDKNVTGGFLITVTGNTVNWWKPECLNSCSFSDSFKSKYPEIVSTTK